MEKTLFDEIVSIYPELLENQTSFIDGTISLRNDSDGFGDYVESWNYEKPLPENLKIRK